MVRLSAYILAATAMTITANAIGNEKVLSADSNRIKAINRVASGASVVSSSSAAAAASSSVLIAHRMRRFRNKKAYKRAIYDMDGDDYEPQTSSDDVVLSNAYYAQDYSLFRLTSAAISFPSYPTTVISASDSVSPSSLDSNNILMDASVPVAPVTPAFSKAAINGENRAAFPLLDPFGILDIGGEILDDFAKGPIAVEIGASISAFLKEHKTDIDGIVSFVSEHLTASSLPSPEEIKDFIDNEISHFKNDPKIVSPVLSLPSITVPPLSRETPKSTSRHSTRA